MTDVMTTVKAWIAAYGFRVLGAVLVLVLGRWIAGLLKDLVTRAMERAKTDQILVSFVGNLVHALLLVIVVISALNILKIPTASFVAVIGAAGLAIGLALQGSLSNFAAGVLLIIFRPFKVDDLIEAAGVLGIVEEIQIFTTQLRTRDNKTVIIPNAKLTADNLINYSAKGTRRVDLTVGVGYGDDLAKVKSVLADVLGQEDRILEEPEPQIAVSEHADSSVNLVVRPWVDAADYWDVRFSLLEAIKVRFDQEGISIPFPQRDVHLYNRDG